MRVMPLSNGGEFTQWEAMKIYNRQERIVSGKTVEAHEELPASSAWGVAGKTYNTLAEAIRQFEQWS
jgi:hypothetical protein